MSPNAGCVGQNLPHLWCSWCESECPRRYISLLRIYSSSQRKQGELESNSAVGAKSADGEETIDFKDMTTYVTRAYRGKHTQ